MTTAKDLVDAIQSGKSATIQATFDSLMTEKIQNGIEAYRQAVIDNTFNPESIVESEEISEGFYVYNHDGKTNKVKKRFATNAAATKHAEKLGGDHKVASQEYWHDKLNPSRAKNESDEDEFSIDSSIDEEFDLSEYTLEEIQEFMESEDFDSLDELSKKTLASYTKNAAISAVVGKEKADASTGAMNQRLSSGDVRGAEYHASKANSANRKVGKRIVGIVKATDKLAKD